MIKKNIYKNYFQLALCSLVVIFFIFPYNKESYATPVPASNKSQPVPKEGQVTPEPKESLTTPHPEETKDEAEDIVEIIVDDKSLKIPKSFKKILLSRGVTGLTIAERSEDGKSQKIHLLSVNGKHINPCLSKSAALRVQSKHHESARPCQYEGGLGETHMLIANRSGVANFSNCDTCTGNNISRNCNINSNKYGCSSQTKKCDTNSSCGD